MFKEKAILYYDKEFLNEEKFKDQIVSIKRKNETASVSLYPTKLNIENELKVESYFNEVFNLINKSLDSESLLSKQKAYSTSLSHAFYYNYPYSVTKSISEKLIEVNSTLNANNSQVYFYLFLLQILNNDSLWKLNYFNKRINKFFLSKEDNDLRVFLEALLRFKNGMFRESKKKLNGINFGKNKKIHSWKRQFLAVINFKQGNIELVKKILAKENKYIQNKIIQGNSLEINSSIFIISMLSKRLHIEIPSNYLAYINTTNTISPLHELMFNCIKKTD